MNRMPVGSKGKGKVVKTTDFGVFVELEKGIEGMIHISELSDQPVDKVTDVVKEGDEVDFVVIATDYSERKISLSRKAYLRNLQGEDLKEYIGSISEPKTSMAEAFSQAQNQQKDDGNQNS